MALYHNGDSHLFNPEVLDWSSERLAFRSNTGAAIQLSENNTVADRIDEHGNTVLFSNKPVSIGQMFKFSVTRTWQSYPGVIFGEVAIGFTGENPDDSTLTHFGQMDWKSGMKHLLRVGGMEVTYNERVIAGPQIDTICPEGRTYAILLTKERDVHIFLSDRWMNAIHVDDFPLDKPMWGVINLNGQGYQCTAEICSVSAYVPTYEARLTKMGLITSAEEMRLQQVQQSLDTERATVASLRSQVVQLQEQKRGHDQQLEQFRTSNLQEKRQFEQHRNRLEQENGQLNREKRQLDQDKRRIEQEVQQFRQQNQHLQQQLTQAQQRQQQSVADSQHLSHQLASVRQQNESLQQRVASPASDNSVSSQEVEFWQVSPEEVSIREDQILGRGAWGFVAKGVFRGTSVAIKRVYPEILQMTTVEIIRREIRTMAQIRHPNLVLFVAAVLDEQTGPMIVTELLDTSLRTAYQSNRIGANKRKIFGDVSSALVYLHRQREPIIHRDVSSANVLLSSLPDDKWLAKLSDFGSANLARYATTPGEGAILYTAPEAYPQPPTSPRPRPPQTTKIDVYSFGVVACEVVTRVFPEAERFPDLLATVGRVWPRIHPLITSCVSHSPQDRPTMNTVLSEIKEMDWEP